MSSLAYQPALTDDAYTLLVVAMVVLCLAVTLWVIVAAWWSDRRADRMRLTRDQLDRTVAEARGREPVR